jgi:molybdopterin/thiamine biosynthesis adenylyltransferase
MLSANQKSRYARHLALPQIGAEGQQTLLTSRVLVIGAGGLGSPAALYLAAAGVGTIGLADPDVVDLSNLQRQILHSTPDLNVPKVESATRKLLALNPDVAVVPHLIRFQSDNASELLKDYQIVLDATDNFDSKFVIAAACHQYHKPYIHAGILAFQGQVMTVLPGHTACYRCVFGDAPPPVGVPSGPMGPVPGVIGAIQAMEAIKYLLKIGELLANRLLVFNALTMRFREVALARNPRCPICAGDGK